jgi:hypothetical protein
MHKGLSSFMINYTRSISDQKKAKTIVKGNKSGKIEGSGDICTKNSYINVV